MLREATHCRNNASPYLARSYASRGASAILLNLTRDPSISVKILRNLLKNKDLRLQRYNLAFRLDFFEIKAPASRRISNNSTRYKRFQLQMEYFQTSIDYTGKSGLLYPKVAVC